MVFFCLGLLSFLSVHPLVSTKGSVPSKEGTCSGPQLLGRGLASCAHSACSVSCPLSCPEQLAASASGLPDTPSIASAQAHTRTSGSLRFPMAAGSQAALPLSVRTASRRQPPRSSHVCSLHTPCLAGLCSLSSSQLSSLFLACNMGSAKVECFSSQ